MRVALVGAEIEENLALRYLSASLHEAGHDVVLLDFHEREQIGPVAEAIVTKGFEAVGMSMIFTARAQEFVELARACRSFGFSGHVVAGGHFASLHAAELLGDEEAFDTVIHGDGEEPMVELLGCLDHRGDVAGVTYRDEQGRIVDTQSRPNMSDLDRRPWPRRPEKFHSYLGKPIANLLSSRGCYANCSFCSIRAFHQKAGGKRFRQREPAAVAGEMAELYHHRGVRIFNFQDDNFFVPSKALNTERFLSLQESLLSEGVGSIAIQAKGRPDCIDEDVIVLLKSMGLFRLFLGIENDAVAGLRTLGRGMDLSHNHRSLEILERQGVHTCFNLLMFDPDSTLESIQKNVDFMRRQRYFPLNFCRTEIYGGTPLRDRLEAEGRLLGDYRGYTYAIADPRAQCAYGIFRATFWERNFAFDGTHFGSMRLDYKFHLLKHFFPSRVEPGQEDSVKETIWALNAHSAELMDQILDFAAGPQLANATARQKIVESIASQRQSYDDATKSRINALIAHIDMAALRAPDRRAFLRNVSAGAAAAATLVVAPGCGSRHTHMCEAPPPDDTYEHIPQEQGELTSSEIEQLRGILQQVVDNVLGPRLSDAFPSELPMIVEVGVEPDGRLAHCQVTGELSELTPHLRQTLDAIGVQITVEAGSPYKIGLVQLQWGQFPREVHMCEAPPPPGPGESF